MAKYKSIDAVLAELASNAVEGIFHTRKKMKAYGVVDFFLVGTTESTSSPVLYMMGPAERAQFFEELNATINTVQDIGLDTSVEGFLCDFLHQHCKVGVFE
jgi:formylmethanofuran dehydrogenase subunit E-like metal-binding protein